MSHRLSTLAAGLLLAIAIASWPPQSSGQEQVADEHRHATEDGESTVHDPPQGTAIAEPTRAAPGEPESPEKHQSSESSWPERLCEILRVPSVTDWLIALATIVYVIVTARTLRAINRQVKIAGDAANAAQVGAEAAQTAARAALEQVEASKAAARAAAQSTDLALEAGTTTRRLERPWLIMGVEKTNVREMLYAARSDEPRSFPVIVQVDWVLANHGRTPAWIINSSRPEIRFVRLPYPAEPPYRFEETEDNTPLPQGSPLTAQEIRPTSREEHDAILAGEAALVFCGIISYRDVFAGLDVQGDLHETRFCFTCERAILSDGLIWVSRFAAGGPASWTKYT